MTTGGEGIAPSTILLHEGVHARRIIDLKTVNDLEDFALDATDRPEFGAMDNPEEGRVISGIETSYILKSNDNALNNASINGTTAEVQGTRVDHRGSLYPTMGVNSIKPRDNIKVKGTEVKAKAKYELKVTDDKPVYHKGLFNE